MKYEQWNLRPGSPPGARAELERAGLPALCAAVLCARGVNTPQQAAAFLAHGPELLHDPFLLRDMDRAAARITQALDQGERMAVYGDYDVDGITSTCLLTEFLRERGGQVVSYIPDRTEEGYGLNPGAIHTLHGQGVSLIITVDCGITAAAEVEYARSLGVDVVITDHHQCKDALPAAAQLESENIFVMTEYRALHQDIRPLRVLILNLMPTKIATETQIMRKLSNTPLQVEVDLLRTKTHEATHVSAGHLETFYRTFDDIRDIHYDGLIITGAPVEQMPFEEVDYWPELCQIMDWSTTHVHSTLHICWGAQAGLYHHYGIQKYDLPAKASGVFEHYLVKPQSPLVRGFDDRFYAVHSRNTDVRREDVEAEPQLEVVAVSDEVGLYIVKSTDSRRFFVFGHPEYDTDTLRLEYERDVKRGLNPQVPVHYFPGDDPAAEPRNVWRSQAQLFYTNWLNYYVYQTTPYDLARAGEEH